MDQFNPNSEGFLTFVCVCRGEGGKCAHTTKFLVTFY